MTKASELDVGRFILNILRYYDQAVPGKAVLIESSHDKNCPARPEGGGLRVRAGSEIDALLGTMADQLVACNCYPVLKATLVDVGGD